MTATGQRRIATNRAYKGNSMKSIEAATRDPCGFTQAGNLTSRVGLYSGRARDFLLKLVMWKAYDCMTVDSCHCFSRHHSVDNGFLGRLDGCLEQWIHALV